jgi:hypothetical protein
MDFLNPSRPEVPKLWGMLSQEGLCWSFGGARIAYRRDIFILNKIRVQDKMFILVSTLLG